MMVCEQPYCEKPLDHRGPCGPVVSLEADVQDLMAERDTLRARVAELERERDAYKKAKAENDERFMLERDTLRAEVDRLREALREMVSAHGDDEGATPNRRRQCSCSACDAARAALAGSEGQPQTQRKLVALLEEKP